MTERAVVVPPGSLCTADELRTLFLFEKLSDEQLGWLCQDGRVEVFEPGPIYSEGEPAACTCSSKASW